MNLGQEFTNAQWQTIQARLGLSDRELEVCRLICAGRKVRAIGNALGIRESTVNTHVRRLYDKIGVHNRAELVMRLLAATTEEQHIVPGADANKS